MSDFIKKSQFIIFLNAWILCYVFIVNPALAKEDYVPNLSDAQYYFLIDADSKEVLLSRNADTRMAPSSMTKLMTALVVFDQIKKGKISLNNQCLIGKDAWRKSGQSGA